VGVTSWLSALAAGRPHLLVVEVPGQAALRRTLERLVRERGWVLATGPADADVLVVCGVPSAAFGEAVESAWDAMAVPRARLELTGDVASGPLLDHAVQQLADRLAQRRDHATRDTAAGPEQPSTGTDQPVESPDAGGMDHSGMTEDVPAMDHAAMGHDAPPEDEAGADMAEMDHAAMGHDMGGMSMELPGGLSMADRAPDRDGLMLDVLHLRLGPLLRSWPAGLVLDVVLQGDVAQAATCSTVDAQPGGPGQGRQADAAVARLDSAARLLDLAGWEAAADSARRLRDRIEVDGSTPATTTDLARLTARVRRSLSLRFALRDLGVLTARRAGELGITGPAARADGDARERLLQWLDEACDARAPEPDPARCAAAVVAALPELVVGLELAGLRLVVASFDPDVACLLERDHVSTGQGPSVG